MSHVQNCIDATREVLAMHKTKSGIIDPSERAKSRRFLLMMAVVLPIGIYCDYLLWLLISALFVK